MKVRTHLWTSVVVGSGLWLATRSSSALVGAIVGGVLMDVDHVFDQVWSIFHGAPYKRPGKEAELQGADLSTSSSMPSNISSNTSSNINWLDSARDWFRLRKLVRLPLIFHSYELLTVAIVAAVILRTPAMLGLVTGYALHLALDLIRHHHEFLSPAFYLLSYRLTVGFRRDRLIKPEYL
jgi:hypothetical protein